jgi:rubredoxin
MRVLCLRCLNRSPEQEWEELQDGARCPACGNFQEEEDMEEQYGY